MFHRDAGDTEIFPLKKAVNKTCLNGGTGVSSQFVHGSPVNHGVINLKETHMKYILTLVAALALTISAQAGCGKKVTTKGTLQSYDAAKKSITVMQGKKKVVLKLTSATKGDASKLKGKAVTVISEHKKVDSIVAAKG